MRTDRYRPRAGRASLGLSATARPKPLVIHVPLQCSSTAPSSGIIFLPRDAMLAWYMLTSCHFMCLHVCPSVRPSAACHGPNCVTLPNFIEIAETAAEIWRFFDF